MKNRIHSRLFSLVSLMFFFPLITKSQDLIVGSVLSIKDRKPLSSVNIEIESNSGKRQLKTDNLGHFIISDRFSEIRMQLSFVGYVGLDTVLKRKDIKQNKLFFVLHERESKLDVVDVNVSTGYQSIPKERSTGAFSFIDKNKMNEQVSPDILSRLDGTVNGLVFDRSRGSEPRISIRGLSTLQASMNAPLVVLDNFPYEGNIDNINPNDIENVTILKDAAAASIWGAKAGNGVIVITTKKGKLNQPIKIDLIVNTTVVNKPNLFYRSQMSSSDFIEVEKMLFSKDYYNNDINSVSRPVLSPVVELLIKRSEADPSETKEIDDQIERMKYHDVREDFDRYIYKKGVNQQYALTLNGGSSSMGWNAFIGSDINSDNLGNIYNRINLRFQNNLMLADNLKLSSNLAFTKSASRSGRQGIGDISSKGSFLYPYARLADEQGNSLAIPKNWRYSFIDTFGNGNLLDWKYYPLEDYKSIQQQSDLSDIIANVSLNYNFLKWFKLDMLYQYERQGNASNSLRDTDSFFARDMINSFTQFNSQGNSVRNIPEGAIIDYQDDLMIAQNGRSQLSFDQKSENHVINAILGAEIRQTISKGHTSRSYGFDQNTMTSGVLDYTKPYPNLITGASLFFDNGISATQRTSRFMSVYGNAAYTYKNRYTVSASARRDASNLFGFKTNDRWKPLWSSGFSWRISEESFYRNSGFGQMIPNLKMRMTYGRSGNIHPSLAAVTTIRYRGNSPYTQLPYASFDKYANPELKWETTAMFNLGLDFGSKNNRLSGSIEYYHKKSSDLFANVPIDYTGGIGTAIVKNAAEMEGRGWDIMLNSLNLDRKFKWTTEFNLSLNNDKILKYYLASDRASSFFTQTGATLTGIEGRPAYSMLSYKWAGLDPQTGAPRGFINGEISSSYSDITGGKTTVNDLVYHGSTSPTVFGSVGNNFSWNGFSASLRIQYKLNYYFRKPTIIYSNLFANWEGNIDFEKRWMKPGDENYTDVPAMIYPSSSRSEAFYQFAEPFVLKGDHIRLQYVNLAYQLKNSLTSRLSVANVKIFFTASNLGIIWRANKDRIDPDYFNSVSILSPSKTFTGGLQITF